MTSSNPRVRVLAVWTVLLAACAIARAAEKGTYAVRYLEPGDAISLLYVRVPEAQECSLGASPAKDPASAGQRGVILVGCNRDGIAAKIEQALAAIDLPSATRRFHVTVLSASRKEGATPDLPPSEAKALADAKKVMTYRSFQVETEAMLQTDRIAATQMGGMYSLELMLVPSRGTDSSINVSHFRLSSAAPTAYANGAQTFTTYFDTSFSIRGGETIVLGTSAAGDAARVVLVTALP